LTQTIPYGTTFAFCGQTLRYSGNYSCTLTSAAGCDSIVNLALTVAPPQALVTTIGQVNGCVGDTISVPVSLQNTVGISALSLAVNYDAANLAFVGAANVNPALSSAFLINAANFSGQQQVRATWFDLNPSVLNGLLFNMRFVVTASSSLGFDLATVGNCEYNDVNADIIPNTQFVNGGVTALQAVTSTATRNIAFGGTFSACGQTFNAPGTYTLNCTAANGCDSIVTLTLVQVNASIAVGNGTVACPGDVITVPVTISDAANLAAISLALNYNTQALSYVSYSGLNPAIANNFLINNLNGQVRVAWFDLTPANFSAQTVLFNLVFNVQGNSPLAWNTATPGDCELGNLDGDIIPTTFTAGSVTMNGVRAVITAASSTTLCTGEQVTLNGPAPAAGVSFQWNLNGAPINGATNSSYTASAAGSFSLTVNSGVGCVSNSNTISVSLRTRPSATISATGLSAGNVSVCQGASVVLNANTGAGFTYQWRLNGNAINGATAASYSANTAGAYSVVVTNSSEGNGCSATSAVVNVIVKPNSSTTISQTIPYGTSFSVCGQAYNTTGTYTKVCVAANGCDSVVTLNLTVSPAVNIGTATTCAGDTVSVPVYAYSANGVGAISLAINYNAANLTFVDATQVNAAVASSIIINAGNFNGQTQIRAGWFDINAINVNGLLFNLRFVGTASSALAFDLATPGNCELADSMANPIAGTVFNSGNITVKNPSYNTISQNIPFQGSFTVCGQSFNTAGTYTITCDGAAANGCDSIVTLNLTVDRAPVITSINNTPGCIGDTISIPVRVQYGNGIGAISLALNYNASALSFIGFENANPAIQSSNLLVNAGVFAGQSQVRLSWFNANPINLGNSPVTLVNYRFVVN
ncbi:MAG: cohesin domain-containing protein, partial [Bacteroidota bacterium]